MNVVQSFCVCYKKMDLLLYLEFGSPAAFCQETPKHLLNTGLQTGLQPGSGVPLGRLPREADTLGGVTRGEAGHLPLQHPAGVGCPSQPGMLQRAPLPPAALHDASPGAL